MDLDECVCGARLVIKGPLDAWPRQMLRHVRTMRHVAWQVQREAYDPLEDDVPHPVTIRQRRPH